MNNYYNSIFKSISEENAICFADTCFLVNEAFLNSLYNYLDEYNKRNEKPITLKIFPSCISELKKLEIRDNQQVSATACKALNLITKGLSQNFEIYPFNPHIKHNDTNMIAATISERMLRPVYIFTQDKTLKQDISSLVSFQSCKGHSIKVMAFNVDGELFTPFTFNSLWPTRNKNREVVICA